MASENYISLLSPHLFWDVDLKDIDPELHKQFIVGRVMGYGTISAILMPRVVHSYL